MLAESRMDKVKGRIKFLILSITTIKGISNLGVFMGTRWTSIALVFKATP